MNDVTSFDFSSFDGERIKIYEMGSKDETAHPVILLHGLFSNAEVNWIKFGHAAKLAEAGFRVIMPDLRAHSSSSKSHDPASYPEDVLAMDIEALIDHFAFDAYDLCGFSMGARTAAKLLVRGAKPRKAVLAGMGLEGLTGWNQRQNFFLDAIAKKETAKRGDPHWMAIQFMKTMKVDTVAVAYLLKTLSNSNPEALADIDIETLILCGADDQDNGNAPKLAQWMINAKYVEIPGTHMSSVTMPELGDALLAFLSA